MLANQGFFSKSYRLLNVPQNGNIVAIATVIFSIDPPWYTTGLPGRYRLSHRYRRLCSGPGIHERFIFAKYSFWAIHKR